MATITNDEDFRKACSHLADNGQLTVAGVRFVDAANRKVLDEQPGNNLDITPNTATLEAALDSALANIAVIEQETADDSTFKQDLLATAEAGLTQIASDLLVLNGTPTNNQILQGLIRTIERQEKLIKAVRAIIRNG